MRATRGIAFSSVLALLALCAGIYFYHTSETGFDRSQVSVGGAGQQTQGPAALDKAGIAESYGKLPVNFEPNIGQVDGPVDFLARGNGYSLFLSGNEALLRLNPRNGNKPAAIKMTMPGAKDSAKATGLNETEGKTNYFIGNDPAAWRTDIANYAKVKYESVYDGIDLVYYGNGQQLEYDFTVSSNSDPDQIRLKFTGITRGEIEPDTGDLLLSTPGGTIRQHRPVVYQEAEGGRTEIASSYKVIGAVNGETEVGFLVAGYDRSKELVIDPVLTYGTYLGGNAFDEGRSITADAAGNAYIVGTAASLNFPTTPGALKTTNPPSTNNVQWYDAFVTKLNPSGKAIIFSTYFGGRNGSETGSGVALDPQGNVIFSGTTMAGDMPVVNAYQGTFGGTDDAFAAKLNPTGSALIYSTFLGGNNTDTGGKIAVNAATGDTVFAGAASSPNFPTTPGAFKERLCTGGQSCNGIFYSGSYIVKLSANGNIIYSTLFDAAASDITLDSSDNATFGGSASAGAPTTPGSFQPANSGGIDGYIAKLNPTGNTLVYGTFLGGGLQSDRVSGITLDPTDNIYVTGRTENTAFPTTQGVLDRTFNGSEDGFATKLNAAGSALVYSTFLGAAAKDQPFAIALGTNNDAFITGETTSGVNFPLRNSFLATGTIFLTRLNPDASAIVYSTYLGTGGGYDIAVDGANNAYVTGHTTNLVVTPNAVQTVRNRNENNISDKDGYAVKVAPADENAATYAISGMVTDENAGYNNSYWPIVVTLTGTVNRQVNVYYSGGPYYFGALPAGGNYTVTVRKTGYLTNPENAVFNGLGANQFADFTLLRNREPEGMVTSPAHGTTYTGGAPINITATASDPDGDPIAKVDFEAYSDIGSVYLGTDTTAPYEFTWNSAGVGTWGIYAIPTDSKGLRGFSTPVVQVHVIDGGVPSVAITSPTEGQTFAFGDYVPLTVNASPAVTRVEIRDQNSNLISVLNGSPWSTFWRVMTAGNFTLTATAFNAQNQTATSTPVNIVVNPLNHRISGRVLDDIKDAPIPNVTVNLTSPTNPGITASTVTDSAGNYLFTNLGTTPNDGVVITPSLAGYDFDPPSRSITYLGYIDWPNQAFIGVPRTSISVNMTSPSDWQIFTAPATINLAANATSGSGTITKVEFYRRQGVQTTLLATDTAAPYEHQLTGVAQGSYSYFARATDSTGGVRNSEDTRVTVNAAITTVRLQGDITNFAGGYMPGVTVLLTGTVNGSPVNQTSVSNFFGAYGFFNLPAGGNYTITPQVEGEMTFTPPSASFTNVTADNVDVDFVSSVANTSPTVQITSPAEGAEFTMPASIPVSATAADANGHIVRLSLSAASETQSYNIGQALGGTISVNWQPNQPGNYTIWANAVDNGGFQTSVSIHIRVNPPSPVSISGRIVDRNSNGIEGVALTLRNYPQEDTIVTTATTDANGNYTIPNLATFTSYTISASKDDYTFTPQRRTYITLSTSQTNGDFTGTLQVPMADFDGDGEPDISVWRPSDGVWHIMRSNDDSYTALQFGGGAFGDVVTPGNFDGDRKTDYAVFRNGIWFIRNSGNEQVWSRQFGMAGDKPVAGDYDGDGKTDLAVWRPSDGVWYIVRSLDGNYDFRQFGMNGDIPLAGDYDGDGIADLTVFRPSEGNWYVLRSSDGQFYGGHFGLQGDVPLVGDFDGDKKCDFTVFRPSEGNWYVLKSSDGGFTSMHWGLASDVPVPGDYDKDGKTDFAVFRGSEGNWYIFLSATGTYKAMHFGATGDVPVPAAYTR
jgi:hypothetical protein